MIRPAVFPDDLALVRDLFRQYAQGLGIDLGFQDFEQELQTLPGKYAEPSGVVLLAAEPGRVMGCIAMRPLEPRVCEMKRLYVVPQARGLAVGRQLVQALMKRSREAGYRRMRLDTLPDMHAAQHLYASLGFRGIAPYVFNPVAGTRFLECLLEEAGL